MITLDQVQSIIDALKITLPADTLPKARSIYKAARRIAGELKRPLPDLAETFALLAAQSDPLSALLNARADGILSELAPEDHMRLLVACRLVRSDMPGDNGILSMAYWSVTD